jgi:dipeptidyl aminopeptidase/acylaminoacyl peptidase
MLPVLLLSGSAGLLAVAGSAWLVLHPPVPRDLGGAPDLDAVARRVRIPVGATDALDGWLIEGRGRGLIVFFHGYGRRHDRGWRYAQFLRAAGYSILAVDFRSSRGGNRVPTTLGVRELEDARATLDWVRGEPSLAAMPLGLLGESLGAAVAIAVAAERDDVRAIAADCPFATSRRALEDTIERWARLPRWPIAPMARALGSAVTGVDPGGLDVLGPAARLRDRPLYLIHAGRDDRLDPSHARDLWRAAGEKDPLWFLPGSGHNEAWRDQPALYAQRMLAFFDRGLHGEGPGLPTGPL